MTARFIPRLNVVRVFSFRSKDIWVKFYLKCFDGVRMKSDSFYPRCHMWSSVWVLYLHSIVHGRDSVYTAFTNGVRAHPDVFLQLVQIGELGWAPVHLDRERFGMLCDALKRPSSFTRRPYKFDNKKHYNALKKKKTTVGPHKTTKVCCSLEHPGVVCSHGIHLTLFFTNTSGEWVDNVDTVEIVIIYSAVKLS